MNYTNDLRKWYQILDARATQQKALESKLEDWGKISEGRRMKDTPEDTKVRRVLEEKINFLKEDISKIREKIKELEDNPPETKTKTVTIDAILVNEEELKEKDEEIKKENSFLVLLDRTLRLEEQNNDLNTKVTELIDNHDKLHEKVDWKKTLLISGAASAIVFIIGLLIPSPIQ